METTITIISGILGLITLILFFMLVYYVYEIRNRIVSIDEKMNSKEIIKDSEAKKSPIVKGKSINELYKK
jgi:hypothetical protein